MRSDAGAGGEAAAHIRETETEGVALARGRVQTRPRERVGAAVGDAQRLMGEAEADILLVRGVDVGVVADVDGAG